ncbi:hypothetical protein AJ78_03543 [Emergomyces pasteurianus Ep9510]|uniref:Uncharacterized protein n=1 Tax=Emergomyces pasteurianus Ep9510 TaxID=1447872 RepID=A0A1J9QK72_9EURO|nr:hypothetical protein AJ78_03543 [Emergomyces pasteurianus Ep9510]
MPLEYSHLSRKRRHPDHPSKTSERPLKMQKISHSPTYWDNLSKIHLTRSAIKEVNRRKGSSRQPRKLNMPTTHQRPRPITRQFRAEQQEVDITSIRLPGFLRDCSLAHLKKITKFSRLRRPGLPDLRNMGQPSLMNIKLHGALRLHLKKKVARGNLKTPKIRASKSLDTASDVVSQSTGDKGHPPPGFQTEDKCHE